MFRTVGPSTDLTPALEALHDLVESSTVLDVPAAELKTIDGFDTAVFPFTTDVPFLDKWGTPLLMGPGSIFLAHTDHEYVEIDELTKSVDLYASLATSLLADA
jgi:acetylornithine deacetylase